MTDNRKYSDRREYLKKAVTQRRRRIKTKAIRYKGGCCQTCGYNKCNGALQFHHIDPLTKNFGISYKGHSKSWEKVQSESDKCVLVCSNCHHEIHAGLRSLSKQFGMEKRGELLEA